MRGYWTPMTVKDLIAKLSELQEDLTVVTDLHSEYSEVVDVRQIEGRENGGYVSRVYPNRSISDARQYVFVGTKFYDVDVDED
jgi:hypothetical protein